MFLRKLIVIAVPLFLLIFLCVLMPVFSSQTFWGNMIPGALLGISLGLLLPLAGATRMREPFAHLLWIPGALILLTLILQYLALSGVPLSVFQVLATTDGRIFTVESAFAAYLITFSVRTGRGV